MESIKKKALIKKVINSALALAVLSLVACGSAPVNDGKPVVYEPTTPEQISTLVYIPELKKNSKGEVLPYKAAANPYLRWRAPIGSSSVNAFIQAKRAFKVKDYGEAERILTALTESNKKLSGPWVMLGDIALEAKKLDESEQHYSKAILLNKNNVNAYLRLAKVKRMQGDYARAKNTYADVLALWKDFPEAHLNLGILYDIYLNDDVSAQKHIEAYQFLTQGRNEDVTQWLLEIQERTGMATHLEIQKEGETNKPVS